MDVLTPETFAHDDIEGIRRSFAEYGLVVVRDVLSPEEVAATVDEIWTSPNLLGRVPEVRREDPETWSNEAGWPTEGAAFLDSVNRYRDIQCLNNRQNPRLHGIFQALLGDDEDIMVTFDRVGVMRPTRGILRADGEREDRPEWRTMERWLHWDQNPYVNKGFHQIQGMLTLTPTTSNSGGFACVPSFHHQFSNWGELHPEGYREGATRTKLPYPIPEDDDCQRGVCKILAPAGALIAWDGRLPHQNYPNDSDQFRLVQYIAFNRAGPEKWARRREAMRQKIEAGYGGDVFPGMLTDLGRRVMGVEEDCLNIEVEPKAREALQELLLAEQAEARGDCMGSVAHYRRAYKLNPKLEGLS